MLEPKVIYNINHPFIDSIYIKKEFGSKALDEGTDILVIEARRTGQTSSREEKSRRLSSFLADLDLIKDEVERKAGPFSRIDIKCC